MGTTLKELLAPNTILGVVDVLMGALPKDHMPAGLFGDAGTIQPVIGDTGYIVRGAGTHRAAKQAMRGSVSRPRTISGIAKRPEALIHSAEHMEIKADDCRAIVDYNANPGANSLAVSASVARSEIARIQRQATTLSMNLRTAAVTSAFALGHIYFDGDGELLASSSGAVIDVDYGIPAANLNQVSSSISASWATASTKIVSKDLDALKLHMRKQSGRIAKHVIYGSDIKQYLMANTEAKEFMFRNMAFNQSMLGNAGNGDVFQLGGLTWWPGYQGFYRNSSDTATTFLPADAIVVLPDPSPDWYQMQEGFELIPTEAFGSGMSLEDLFNNTMTRQGIFQYADGMKDPIRGKLVYGDNFLPAIHVPEAVIIADVVP